MFSAMQHRRQKLVGCVQELLERLSSIDETDQTQPQRELTPLLVSWLAVRDEKSDKCTLLFDKMKPHLKDMIHTASNSSVDTLAVKIWSERDMFPKVSQWICGGDGWAYDIGFGGLDHVQAFEANDVNVLVVDTEMYSNTGGQQSKATPAGASVKFAIGGKQQKKKSLGELFMTYEHVYVASVSLHNQAQTLRALVEADQHNGPSVVIAYAPCIQQGVRPDGLNDMFDECKFAVESGYWPLYRFKPSLADEGQNPFILDSKKLRKDVASFLQRESRFVNLRKTNAKVADVLWQHMNQDVHHRMEHLRQLAEGYNIHHGDEPPVITLFASETGTAAQIARDFAAACPLSSTASALDDVDVEDLDGKTAVFFVATCGQGAMPQNGKSFLSELVRRKDQFMENTKFLVFGLGDSSYYFFAKAAKDIEEHMSALGAKLVLGMGLGDDADDGGMEQGLHDWLDAVWSTLDLEAPKEVPTIVPVAAHFSEKALAHPADDHAMVEQFFNSMNAVSTAVLSNDLMCEPNYNRDFRTIRLSKSRALTYELGDALEIYPRNDPDRVWDFLHRYSSDFGDNTVVKLDAFGMDGDVSLGVLFTYVLDLFGKPTKHFLQQLATFENDENERKVMLDHELLNTAAKETGMTVADALLRFRKAQPPLPALLAMIPMIKPRAYSIASAPFASKSSIELLVSIETWWCVEGKRYGLTCDMLRNLSSGDRVWCRIKPGSMEPPTPQQPVLCAGIGSGLAPHMAFLRDRVRAAEAGEAVGPFALYFGNRYEAHEFLYRSELQEYQRRYSDWFTLHVAFSRDDPTQKVYVQDLVASNDDARRLLLRHPDGALYVCGNRNLPKPLQAALIESFCADGESDRDSAAHAMEDLFVHGRAQQEVW